jgi:signal transduction histidine kinase
MIFVKAGGFGPPDFALVPMNATFHATRGSRHTTGNLPQAGLRLLGLVVTAVLGSGLIIWVNYTTWVRVERLQRGFATLNADRFYSGVYLRGKILHLNETLLRYCINHSPHEGEAFRKEAGELTEWFVRARDSAATPLEREFFEKASRAYTQYLTDGSSLLEPRNDKSLPSKKPAPTASYDTVQKQSSHLLDLCNGFLQRQRDAFADFLRESDRTLAGFRRLSQVSMVLLLCLAALLTILVYRGMIAPLRHRLTESQALLVRQEKLASLGVLAAGVAHEIRNPLTAIKFRLFSLKKALPPGGAEDEDAVVIGSEINRLERIVKDFLQFARPSEPELREVPAQRLLQEVLELLKPQLDRCSIRMSLEASPSVWVRADTQQIKQVLINLIQNSADSIGRDGEIKLRVRRDADSPRNGEGAFALLEVSDTGKGIPPSVQDRLFDPFFTTKEGGSGLGLPIAARIVEKHGGLLRYQTQVDVGTTFSIALPLLNEHETEDPADRR